jgi:hypothetical protein
MPIDGGSASGLPEATGSASVVGWIVNEASQLLKDATNEEWTVDVLLPHLWGAIMEVINAQPDAYGIETDIELVAGATQAAPAGTLYILDAVCNMGVSGTDPGNPIHLIDRKRMDILFPGWMAFPAEVGVEYVVIDPENKKRSPMQFGVFPPQEALETDYETIRLVTTPTPAEITSVDDAFPLDDTYRMAVVDFVVALALSEENTIPNALSKSQAFRTMALQKLGIRAAGEKAGGTPT